MAAETPSSLLAIGHRSNPRSPLPPKAPLDVSAGGQDARHLLSELLLERRTPRHELEPDRVIDHGEAAGRERDPLAVDARDMLALGGRAISEPGLR
jgi:hypothetical protein